MIKSASLPPLFGLWTILGLLSGCCVGGANQNVGKLTTPQLISHEGYSTVALVFTEYDNMDSEVSDVKPYCSGVWIDNSHILTAYHCVQTVQERLRSRWDIKEEVEVDKPPCDAVQRAFGLCDDEEVKHVKVEMKGLGIHYVQWGEADDVGREPTGQHLAEVVGWDENFDLAVLKAEGNAIPKHDNVKLAGAVPGLGEKIYVCGHPKGLYWTFLEGSVSGYRGGVPHVKDGGGGPFLQLQVPIYFGNSGGGAFDGSGELIGIADFLMRDVPGEGFYIPVESIKKFLIKNKINNSK
jgi:hypothetical protein